MQRFLRTLIAKYKVSAVFLLFFFAFTTLASSQQTVEASGVITQVSTHARHSCALVDTNDVFCWGLNIHGQLGNGLPSDYSTTPQRVLGLNGVEIDYLASGGGWYTCAVTIDGDAYCWGLNDWGMLGDGTIQDRYVATQVIGLTEPVVELTLGGGHTCAILQSGLVYCWGDNEHGQLGNGTTADSLTASPVIGLPANIAKLDSFGAHTCAVTAGGAAYCWGLNDFMQLGDGTKINRLTPIPVTGLSSGIADVSVGQQFSCALTALGDVLCWGHNGSGQLGTGGFTSQAEPTQVLGLQASVVTIDSGYAHNCVLLTDSTVSCWGRNQYGQMGLDLNTSFALVPVTIEGVPTPVVSVSSGSQHSCMLTENDGAFCLGWNEFGQLGDGSTTDSNVPQMVDGFETDSCRPEVVAIYALAGDNDPASTLSINSYIRGIVNGLVAATETSCRLRAIVLSDHDRFGDTNIQIIENGVVTPIAGLPDINGNLDLQTNEYDMADGADLGGFLRWSLENYADEDALTTFHFVGHGTYAMPDGDFPDAPGSRMPYEIGSNPSYTDIHPEPRVIAPQDLRTMLEIGTNDGARSLDVLDLTHCFAATAVELVELINPNGPAYATVVTASPSYNYVAETLSGAALQMLNGDQTAQQAAQSILEAYAVALSEFEDGVVRHPGIWGVFDMQALDGLKPTLDELASLLNIQLNTDFDATVAILRSAQQAAAVYDTTFGLSDWTLDDTDSLVDIGSFMQQLIALYAQDAEIRDAALAVMDAADSAVLSTVRRSGTPYFAPATSSWDLDTSERLGIALFAPFTAPRTNNMPHIPWQWEFYVGTPMPNYPNPFALLVAENGAASWGTIVHRFWERESVVLLAELPFFPPVQQAGELLAREILQPVESAVYLQTPTRLSALINANQTLYGVRTRFEVRQNGESVFVETVTSSTVFGGDNLIETNGLWVPALDTPFEVVVSTDADQRIIEQLENDNTLSRDGGVVVSAPGPVITATQTAQFFPGRTLSFSYTSTQPLSDGRLFLYQFENDPFDPTVRVAQSLGEVAVALTGGIGTFSLPESLPAGTYRADFWGLNGSALSANYQQILFNYAPAGYVQSAEITFFRYQAMAGETLNFTLENLAGNVAWYLWSPGTALTALRFEGDGSHTVANAANGEYVLMMERLTSSSTYTLSVQRNGQPARALNPNTVIVQRDRPIHTNNILLIPERERERHRVFIPVIRK